MLTLIIVSIAVLILISFIAFCVGFKISRTQTLDALYAVEKLETYPDRLAAIRWIISILQDEYSR